MKRLTPVIRIIFVCLFMISTQACVSHDPDLLERGVVNLEPPASVASPLVYEEDGKLFVKGTITVPGKEESYVSGALHARITSPDEQLIEEQTVCFASEQVEFGGHKMRRKKWVRPEFKVRFSKSVPPGSILALTPHLNERSCEPHPSTIG